MRWSRRPTVRDAQQQVTEPGSEQVLERVPDIALPAACAEAFERFEADLQQAFAEQPPFLERQLGGREAVFIPDYEAVKPSSWRQILKITAVLWVLVLVAFGLLGTISLLALPTSVSGPVTLVVYALGGLALVGVTYWYVGGQVRSNRRKRRRGRPAALGVFLFADALVQRSSGSCCRYPRACILSVYQESIQSSGGSSTSPRSTGRAFGIRFRDNDGKERKNVLYLVDASPTADTRRVGRLRRWFAETG